MIMIYGTKLIFNWAALYENNIVLL